jgi:hypothetical protein
MRSMIYDLYDLYDRLRPKAVKRKVAKRPFADINVLAIRRAAQMRARNEPAYRPSG